MPSASAASRAISEVPSVEPSSTTMTSIGWVLCASDLRVLAMHSFSLYAGTITLTGRVTGAPQVKRRLLRCL